MEKIPSINKVIEEYFSINKSVDEIRPKDLMPLLIKRGVFEKDIKNGLPLRKVFRDLDSKNQLHRIPSLFADRKAKYVYWYIRRNNGSIPSTD